jgi:hypothetical protein
MGDVLASARAFAVIQRSLLASLDKMYPFLATGDLDCLPKAGTITALESEWAFRRHGAGVKFVSSDGVIIDAHRSVTVLGGIDAWRLARYLSSIQKSDVNHRDLEKTLSELLETGDIRPSDEDRELYELRSLE